ncbi:MAG: UvrB/UvrC motif-containing protein [Gemmataceae bacterium]
MKCQRCPKQVTYHITEIHSEDQVDELNFCEECAKKYLFQTPIKSGKPSSTSGPDVQPGESSIHGQAQCPECGIRFVEFRNGGRLGCPNDYDVFREDLLPLLESVHGEPKHTGKMPRHRSNPKGTHHELSNLRKKLQVAVDAEKYEEAANLRDRIKRLETK